MTASPEIPDTGMHVSRVTLALGMFHVTALLVGHVVGNKATEIGPLVVTLTFVSFPITFLTTDLLNEHCGHAAARRVTVLALCCVLVAAVLIEGARWMPAARISHVPEAAFDQVLRLPLLHTTSLLFAYVLGQLADIGIFRRMRDLSRGSRLWLRVVGSTAIGELVEGAVITGLLMAIPLGFRIPVPQETLVRTAAHQGLLRMAIVLAMLPLVYVVHLWLIRARGPSPGTVPVADRSTDSNARRFSAP